MAKVTPAPAIESISGKLCSKNGQYIALNKHTGKMFLAEYHEREDKNTELQQAVRATFTSRSQAASAWWQQNKPTSSNKEGTADYQQLIKQYRAQHKIGNPYAYLRSLVQPDLTIRIGGKTITAPSGDNTTTPPSGGGGGSMDG